MWRDEVERRGGGESVVGTNLFKILISDPLLAAGSRGSDRRLPLFATSSRALLLLFLNWLGCCPLCPLSGQHFIPQAHGQLPVLLIEFAQTVFRHPIVPTTWMLEMMEHGKLAGSRSGER